MGSARAALPHRRAGLGRGLLAAGRGGRRGADVAARQAAGEAERQEAAAGSAQPGPQLQRPAAAALLPDS